LVAIEFQQEYLLRCGEYNGFDDGCGRCRETDDCGVDVKQPSSDLSCLLASKAAYGDGWRECRYEILFDEVHGKPQGKDRER
jgi:hypothetical protein